ncbi:MAG: hypothetical protein AAF632_19700 [Bacteroidota bacterium]
MVKPTILLVLFTTFTSSLFAQMANDVIYPFDGEPLACLVASVSEDKIHYKNAPTSPQESESSFEKDQALLIFRENGDFLLPYGDNPTWVKGSNARIHKIITKDHSIYPALFLEIDGTTIHYQDYTNKTNQEVSTDNVLLIIRKDGSHELFAPTTEVVEALAVLSQNMEAYTSSKGVDAEEVPEVHLVELSADEEAHFIEIAETKAGDFGRYLGIICDPRDTPEDKLYSVDAAVKLFVSDSAKIEVSSTKSERKKYFTVRDYLDRLRILPYDRVDITWMQASMVCGLRPGLDGKYYGVIAAQQLFKGYMDNKVVYQDVTEKDVEVVLTRYEVFDEGERQQKWDVFLSNIGVQQTRNK